MKRLALFLIVGIAFTGATHASCTGYDSFKTCTDDAGNSYTVQRLGNTMTVRGSNLYTGNRWSQSTNRIGNSSYTNGYDAEGNSWNSSARTIGNTTYQSGYDSNGRHFNNTIRRNGSTTNYSGYDSNGNYYNKTCNSYGCY